MRMLFFLYSLEGGGAERVTAELANHWAGKGRTVKIVTIAAGRSDFYRLDSRIQRVCLNLDTSSGNVIIGAWQNVKRILALRRELRRFQPDVAIAMMTTANVLLAWAARGLGGIVTVGSER